MKLSSFILNLPENLVAKYPPKYRENARLMVVHRSTGKIEHLVFSDIINFFKEGDALVLNDSKVFAARLYGYKERTEARIEAFLLRELNPKMHLWDTIINPARKIRVGNKLYFIFGDYALVAEVIDNTTSRGRTVRFLFEGSSQEFHDNLEILGKTPLPLKRKAEPLDKERYQTVYAKKTGSTLVPDGGLHFTPYILKLLELKDVKIPAITLHTSINTITPLAIQDLSRYTLNSEYYEITQSATEAINTTLEQKKKVCAVGVSTLKALESSIASEKQVKPIESWTNKFIHPPYKPQIVNALLTNFHLPNTTPFINTFAFGGYDLIMKVYDVAIKEKYQFFVYGDALLIL